MITWPSTICSVNCLEPTTIGSPALGAWAKALMPNDAVAAMARTVRNFFTRSSLVHVETNGGRSFYRPHANGRSGRPPMRIAIAGTRMQTLTLRYQYACHPRGAWKSVVGIVSTDRRPVHGRTARCVQDAPHGSSASPWPHVESGA